MANGIDKQVEKEKAGPPQRPRLLENLFDSAYWGIPGSLKFAI